MKLILQQKTQKTRTFIVWKKGGKYLAGSIVQGRAVGLWQVVYKITALVACLVALVQRTHAMSAPDEDVIEGHEEEDGDIMETYTDPGTFLGTC